MYTCIKCGSMTAKYDWSKKEFYCTDEKCKHIEKIQPKIGRCMYCLHPYTWFVDFDPSGCPNCHRSFVD